MKISKIILPIILLIACSLPSMAQTMYEYAMVTILPHINVIQFSINGTEYYEKKIDKEEVKGYGDVNSAILEIYKMSEDNWEIYETNTAVVSNHNARLYTFLLRRNKQ